MVTTNSYYYGFGLGIVVVSLLVVVLSSTDDSVLSTKNREESLFVAILVASFDWYMQCLEVRPVLTKSTTTAFIQYLGDYFAQIYEGFRIRNDGDGDEKALELGNLIWTIMSSSSSNYDLRRGISMAADGMFISGPLLHYAFEFLERILPTEQLEGNDESSWLSVATALHVLANDYIVDTIYLLVSFLFVAIAEGHVRDLPTLVRKDLLATLKASWGTSVALMPVEYLCFSQLPISLRVLSMNFIDILWGAIISFVAHRSRRQSKHPKSE
jgi:hypothetical protein